VSVQLDFPIWIRLRFLINGVILRIQCGSLSDIFNTLQVIIVSCVTEVFRHAKWDQGWAAPGVDPLWLSRWATRYYPTETAETALFPAPFQKKKGWVCVKMAVPPFCSHPFLS